MSADYDYDAFGALRSGTPGTNPYRFAGEQQDYDTKSQPYYLRARMYDPVTGLW